MRQKNPVVLDKIPFSHVLKIEEDLQTTGGYGQVAAVGDIQQFPGIRQESTSQKPA